MNKIISRRENLISHNNSSLLLRQATDWFKGLAVLLIVISHYADWWGWFTPSEGDAELFRQGLMKLGDYGAALFLLFSGYGLVKSLKGGRVGLKFVWKRLRAVYLPYLVIAGLIQAYAGGFENWKHFAGFLMADDYWYLVVLFSLYAIFMVLWAIPMKKWLRVLLFAGLTFLFSWKLYADGKAVFWFASNFAFPLGVLIAEYEKSVQWLIDRIGWILIPILAVLMIPVIRTGLGLNEQPVSTDMGIIDIWKLMGAQLNWCLFAVAFAAKWFWFDPVLQFLGKCSLYIYLTHTFIFMRCVNSMECGFAGRFAAAAVLTLAVAAVFWLIFSLSFNNKKR